MKPTYDPRIRLYVDDDLAAGQTLGLAKDKAHYLGNVMRLTAGDTIALFNGRDGEWLARLENVTKNRCEVALVEQRMAQPVMPDLWLVFAPIKKARIDFVAEKATELGVSEIRPVITRRTVMTRVNTGRLAANAREAAEQCERLEIPRVVEPVRLEALLAEWPQERRLLWCDEQGSGPPIAEGLLGLSAAERQAPWAILIGPEGGFDDGERDQLGALDYAFPVSLGPRVLRADTAAAAALSVWQSIVGDWGAGNLT